MEENNEKNYQDLLSLTEEDLKEIFFKMSLKEINEFLKKIEKIVKGIENNG